MATGLSGQLIRKYLLIFGDIAILYFSFWLTLLIRYQAGFNQQLAGHLLPFSIVFAIILVIFYVDELYEVTVGRGLIDLLNRLLRSLAIGGGFAVVFFYLGYGRLFTIKPQRVLLIYLVVAGVLLYLWRALFRRLAKSSRISNGLILVGWNSLAAEIAKVLVSKPELGFSLKAIVVDAPVADVPAALHGLVTIRGFDQIKSVCVEHGANTVVSVIHPRENPSLLRGLFDCLSLKINFTNIANFYENVTGKIPVTAIEQIWFLENLTERRKRLYDVAKRLFDIVFAVCLLILTLPLIPIVALFIKLDSEGPVLFRQVRTGRDGKSFTAIKFRTMIQNAEQNGPQWAVKNDTRVTKLGRLLRKTRIDEIPQLINVFRGEMSLIGPRPERPEFVEQLQSQMPFYKERLLIKPGLTGWAQVAGPAYGGSKEESLEKLQYDLYYIKNRSIGLDISIMLRTIRTVLSRQGQ